MAWDPSDTVIALEHWSLERLKNTGNKISRGRSDRVMHFILQTLECEFSRNVDLGLCGGAACA